MKADNASGSLEAVEVEFLNFCNNMPTCSAMQTAKQDDLSEICPCKLINNSYVLTIKHLCAKSSTCIYNGRERDESHN